MTLHFSTRSRALASLVTALAQILATGLMGTVLDYKPLTINQRARNRFLFIMSLSGGIWTWAIIIQHKYQRTNPALDWVDSAFGEGWSLCVSQQVEVALTYNYGYWLVGVLAKRPAEILRCSSVARGVEAAGQCVASKIASTAVRSIVSAGLIMGWWGVAVPPGFVVFRRIGVEHVGVQEDVPAGNVRDVKEPDQIG
ncbi:hypothetical protein Q7P35_006295 [Cladosporium inversicolor]